MKSILILFVGIAVILWAMRVDVRFRPYKSAALLLPFLWIVFISSRPPAYWASLLFGVGFSGADVEGSPINSVVYFGLMLAALATLTRRGFDWVKFLRMNWPLLLIYVYYLVSVSWSPLPVASCKRLIKVFGCVIMALVILTETSPAEAIRLVFARVTFLLLPLSLIFAKYFPSIGRATSESGESNYAGVCFHKNSLGVLLIVSIIMLAWEWFELKRKEESRGRTRQMRVLIVMFAIAGMLLALAHCATAYICLIVAFMAAVAVSRLVEKPYGKKLLITGLVLVGLLFAADRWLGISAAVAGTFGRNSNFTDRTEIWQGVLNRGTNPWFGCGFYSFWNTSLATDFFEEFDFITIKTAHNGYLEAYLDGGWIAVAMLVIWLLMTGKRTIDTVFTGTLLGRFGFVFWLVSLLYNYSESDFFRMEPLWICLVLVGIHYPPSEINVLPITQPNREECGAIVGSSRDLA